MDALVQAARVLDVALADGGLRGDEAVGHMLWPAAGILLTIGKEYAILDRRTALAFAEDLRLLALDA